MNTDGPSVLTHTYIAAPASLSMTGRAHDRKTAGGQIKPKGKDLNLTIESRGTKSALEK